MTAGPARVWAWSTAALAAALALGLSWCIAHSPLTLYDGLGPILDAQASPGAASMWESAWRSSGYWRPLRLTQIKLLVDASADVAVTFKAVHVALTFAAFLLFAAWIRPRSLSEFVAGAIALMIVAGHHSFFTLFSEAYPVNHFLEIVALTLAVGVLARGRPARWKDVLAPILLAIGLLTIESGILIGVAAATCWIVGWRGISGRGIAAIALVIVAYMGLRFIVLDIPGPALDERATGWWLSRLEPADIVARFGANPLPFYAYNVMAALLDVLLSEPRAGTWLITERWTTGSLEPWTIVHLASSTLVTAVMIVAFVPTWRRWRRGAATERDRFVLAAFALVAANAGLSFGYVKDEVLSVGAVLYAGGAFASLAALGDRLQEQRAHVFAGVVLVCASALWSSRAAGTFLALQASAYKVATDWAVYSLERELPADWAAEDRRRTFLELRQWSVERGVPHPAFTPQRKLSSYLEIP